METGTLAEWFSGGASAAAVVVALAGYGILEWQRVRDRKHAEQTAGRQVGVKLTSVLNGSHDIYRRLWAPYKGPPLGGENSHELWRTIHPLVGLEHEPGLMLTPAEIDLLVSLKATDFMMDLMLATKRYQSIISSMKDYGVRYEALYQMMPPPAAMDGAIGQHKLSEEDFRRIRPYSLQLESLIQALGSMTAENIEICGKLAERYHPIMTGHFKGPFMSIKMSDAKAKSGAE